MFKNFAWADVKPFWNMQLFHVNKSVCPVVVKT